jgi:hypothetical protein
MDCPQGMQKGACCFGGKSEDGANPVIAWSGWKEKGAIVSLMAKSGAGVVIPLLGTSYGSPFPLGGLTQVWHCVPLSTRILVLLVILCEIPENP